MLSCRADRCSYMMWIVYRVHAVISPGATRLASICRWRCRGWMRTPVHVRICSCSYKWQLEFRAGEPAGISSGTSWEQFWDRLWLPAVCLWCATRSRAIHVNKHRRTHISHLFLLQVQHTLCTAYTLYTCCQCTVAGTHC